MCIMCGCVCVPCVRRAAAAASAAGTLRTTTQNAQTRNARAWNKLTVITRENRESVWQRYLLNIQVYIIYIVYCVCYSKMCFGGRRPQQDAIFVHSSTVPQPSQQLTASFGQPPTAFANKLECSIRGCETERLAFGRINATTSVLLSQFLLGFSAVMTILQRDERKILSRKTVLVVVVAM